MTDKDKHLISDARAADDFSKVHELESQAESKEAKEILHLIASSLYHRDVYEAGIL